MNVLNHDIAPEFESILNKVENDSNIRAAVLISGKPDNFIAGADIKMLVSLAGHRPARMRIAHADCCQLCCHTE